MIAYNCIKAIEKAIKPHVRNIHLHPQGRGKVGNKMPTAMIRKGDEEVSDIIKRKGHITKRVLFEIMLITEYNNIKQLVTLQENVENAIMNIDLTTVTGLDSIEWAGVETPPASQSINAFSFDIANITGNRQLTIIRFYLTINQAR